MKTCALGLILSALSCLCVCANIQSAEETEKKLEEPYYISPRSGAQHISLTGKWDLGYRDLPATSLEDLHDQRKWISVQVPSSVQWALYEAGELPHPYYHLNSQKYTWVADKVWY